MLAIARFDAPEEAETPEEPEEALVDMPSPESELLELLELSLQEERAVQNQLQNELEAREESIAEKEAAIQQTQAELSDKEKALAEAQRLAEAEAQAKADAQKKNAQIAATLEQTAALKAELERTLSTAQQSSQVTLERLRQTEATLAKAEADKQALEDEKAQVEAQRHEAERKAQSLSTELRVAETERNLIAKNLENAQIQLETVQIEKQALQKQTAELTEGVSNLAETSKEIRKEIQENQPLSPANIFSQYREQQVTIRWQASYSGLFGNRNRDLETTGVHVDTPQGKFIIFLTTQTPFAATTQWAAPQSIRVDLVQQSGEVTKPSAILFSSIDPRIAMIPYNAPEYTSSASSIQLSKDPFRFDKALVVHAENGHYGESGYRLSAQSDLILDMDSKIFSGLFGEFDSKEGDFVFAMTGNLAALMVNGDKAIRLENASSSLSIPINQSYRAEQANSIMQQINARIARLPQELK